MGRWNHRICVILVNWNGKNDTLECLASLDRCTYPKFTPIVIDNGSTDGSVEAIRAARRDTPIFQLGENLGFAGGNNVGIKWALGKPFDWILLLNNDTTVAPDFFESLLQTASEHPQAKIFGAKILRYSQPGIIDHLGGKWVPERAEFTSLHSGVPDSGLQTPEPVDYVCGAALLMHRTVPETIGLLEPNFFLFWEETDYCFRARRKGLSVYTAPNARVWHKVSSSFSGGKPHTHYFWWRSRLLWIERNLPLQERRSLLKQTVYPELRKTLRHYLLKSLQRLFHPRNRELEQKQRRLKAGLIGAFHYFTGRFGNCPRWLIVKT